MSRIERSNEKYQRQDSVKELARAVEEVERDHPLPKCRHGNNLRDGAGEALEPSCGCRAALPSTECGEK